ncbi:MAG: CRTAC1 family protein, partial [bacterium]|nr:CRTAC1 family protein [bacterium]
MNEHHTDRDPQADELVPADDAIIGKALRGSLIVAAGIAVAVAVAFLLVKRPQDEGPGVAMATTAPRPVERELSPPPVVWTDVTAAAGIDFVHVNGATGEKL